MKQSKKEIILEMIRFLIVGGVTSSALNSIVKTKVFKFRCNL